MPRISNVGSGSGSGSGAPTNATYITQTSNTSLTNEQALADLSTGILKSTTGTGVVSIATEGTDYYKPTGTDVAVADGGTGASTAAAARTNLGLGSIATQDANNVSITGGSVSGITDLAVADGGTGASTAAGARTNLGLVIGTDVQAYDAELAALAGLTSAADKLPYFTGSGTAATTDLTTAGRALIDDADAATQRTTLGLGSIATQAASSVSITGGSITGITDLAVADGGTGSSTAAGARTNLSAAASGANTDITSVYLDNTGLKVKDTDASHGLTFKPGSNITADRTLTVTTGDADRTLTLNGDTTLSGTNTGDQTITLTGDVTGSGTGSFATTLAKAGVPIQYQVATTSTDVSESAGTYTDVTGLSVNITPTDNNNEIIIRVCANGLHKNTSGNFGLSLQLVRVVSGSPTTIAADFIDAFGYGVTTGTNAYIGSASFEYKDAPATTSQVTYKVQIKAYGTPNTVGINKANSISSISATEVIV